MTDAYSSAAASLTRRLQARADDLGLDGLGVADLKAADTHAKLTQAGERLEAFLQAGHQGDMNWLTETADRRRHPRALWPGARSAVVIAQNYGPPSDPLADLQDTGRGVVSAYARGRDYHDVLKGRLKVLAGELHAWTGSDVKVFVDTAPLMEKPLAAVAGLGWQGKHTNLVSRAHGSWLFLGVILTSAELAPSPVETDHCGRCQKCLDICPTDAFPAPYRLDATRCLAYWSIEHKGHIPEAFRKPMGNRVFGCDDCLAVCPWNKFASETREAKYQAKLDDADRDLTALLALTDQQFRDRFAGTPVKRTGRDRFVRNVCIAAGNTEAGYPKASLVQADPDTVVTLLNQRAADDSPLVRLAAVWGLAQQLSSSEFEAAAKDRLARELDADVAAEWHRHSPLRKDPEV